MYRFIVLVLICLSAPSSFGTSWNKFDKSPDYITLDSPGFTSDFALTQGLPIKHDDFTPPEAETGFIPSVGKYAESRPVASSQTHGQPLRSTQYRPLYRHVIHKNPIPRPSTIVTKYQAKPLPLIGKYTSGIYKPNVGSQLSKLREDPIYFQIRSNVNAQGNRLKGKEKYPNGVNGDVLNQQQNENYEPKYEKYVTQNEPHYYTKPHGQIINYDRIQQKNKYPLPNHGHIKIHPYAYNPLKSDISALRQKQHQTFSKGNDYPGKKVEEKPQKDEIHILSGGQDILNKQENLFNKQNQNIDNTFSKFVKNQHPDSKLVSLANEDSNSDNVNIAADFVPFRTYAQVRHSETVKHLPRGAAFDEAETSDEVLNAPRLREAVKTSKAQTVYTEEGYEDVAYDHAGHLKHASNQEGYSGYSKGKSDNGKEANVGKHSEQYSSGGKSKHGSDISKGKKWIVDKDNNEEFHNKNSFSLQEGEHVSKDTDLTSAGSSKLILSNNDKHSDFSETLKLPSKGHHSRNRMREKLYNSDQKNNESQKVEVSLQSVSTKVNDKNLRFRDGHKEHNNRHFNKIDSKKIENKEKPETSEPPADFTGVDEKDQHTKKKTNLSNKNRFESDLQKSESLKVLPLPEIIYGNRSNSVSPYGGKHREKPASTPKERLNSIRINKITSNDKSKVKESLEDFSLDDTHKLDVEVFSNMNNKGPRHGGNYRRENETTSESRSRNIKGENKLRINSGSINGHAKNINKKESQNKEWSEFENDFTSEIKTTSNRDQLPVTSDVEIFRSDFVDGDSPKHGGNYRKLNDKKVNGLFSRLEDFETSNLHGGNYKNADNFDRQPTDQEQEISVDFSDEGVPASIINNIAFLTSNMTVPKHL